MASERVLTRRELNRALLQRQFLLKRQRLTPAKARRVESRRPALATGRGSQGRPGSSERGVTRTQRVRNRACSSSGDENELAELARGEDRVGGLRLVERKDLLHLHGDAPGGEERQRMLAEARDHERFLLGRARP